MEGIDGNIYVLLADILEYPTPMIAEQAKACENALAQVDGQASKHLSEFGEYCVNNSLSRLEELYTDTFDLDAICCPYVGFHLFGEERTRGMFMVKLKEHYRAQNYPLNGELPDHLSVMLRFLAGAAESGETRDLTRYCLIPALGRMISLFKDKENPYGGVLRALLAFLETEGNG